ncbi:MAG: hypothetical protein WDO69_24200 [Pseudomonadota bacterium]
MERSKSALSANAPPGRDRVDSSNTLYGASGRALEDWWLTSGAIDVALDDHRIGPALARFGGTFSERGGGYLTHALALALELELELERVS